MITLFLNQPKLSPGEMGLWRLDEPWAIRLPVSGRTLEIAAGFQTDGASIPRVLWTLVGHPFEPLRAAPALAHDALYEARLVSRSEADAEFRALLRANDDTAMDAQLCWLGVRMGGWWPWMRYSARSIAQARELCRLLPLGAMLSSWEFHPPLAPVERFCGWDNLSDAMQRQVMAAIRRHVDADPECQWCGAHDFLTAHHVVPVAVDPERALEDANLITLCRRCHFVVAHFCDWRRFNPSIRSLAETFGDRG